MRFSSRGAYTLALLCTIAAFGCGSDEESPGQVTCSTEVTSITSPAPGVATMHGDFLSDESVIIQETDGTVIAQGTPDSDRNAFTLTGVPSGDHHYEIVISCGGGRENLGSFDFNIQ
jgi:hypothetical protein